VIRHLTSEIAPTELERLMLKVLPEQFLDAGFDTGDDQQMEIRRAVRLCYRTAFEIADPDTKAKAVKKVIKTIKEGSELQVTNL